MTLVASLQCFFVFQWYCHDGWVEIVASNDFNTLIIAKMFEEPSCAPPKLTPFCIQPSLVTSCDGDILNILNWTCSTANNNNNNNNNLPAPGTANSSACYYVSSTALMARQRALQGPDRSVMGFQQGEDSLKLKWQSKSTFFFIANTSSNGCVSYIPFVSRVYIF